MRGHQRDRRFTEAEWTRSRSGARALPGAGESGPLQSPDVRAFIGDHPARRPADRRGKAGDHRSRGGDFRSGSSRSGSQARCHGAGDRAGDSGRGARGGRPGAGDMGLGHLRSPAPAGASGLGNMGDHGARPRALPRPPRGSAEAVLMAVLAIAFARALDLRGRAAVVAASLVFWSGALTLFTGYNKGFAEMALVIPALAVLGIRALRRGEGWVAFGLVTAAALTLH